MNVELKNKDKRKTITVNDAGTDYIKKDLARKEVELTYKGVGGENND